MKFLLLKSKQQSSLSSAEGLSIINDGNDNDLIAISSSNLNDDEDNEDE